LKLVKSWFELLTQGSGLGLEYFSVVSKLFRSQWLTLIQHQSMYHASHTQRLFGIARRRLIRQPQSPRRPSLKLELAYPTIQRFNPSVGVLQLVVLNPHRIAGVIGHFLCRCHRRRRDIMVCPRSRPRAVFTRRVGRRAQDCGHLLQLGHFLSDSVHLIRDIQLSRRNCVGGC
jgi:hypothetical protein